MRARPARGRSRPQRLARQALQVGRPRRRHRRRGHLLEDASAKAAGEATPADPAGDPSRGRSAPQPRSRRSRSASTAGPSGGCRRRGCSTGPASGRARARPSSWPSSGLQGRGPLADPPGGAGGAQRPRAGRRRRQPIAPADAWGHDHLWWLDRMVRSNQPLVERMALVFHDWFATSNDGVSQQQQMIDQSNLFRSRRASARSATCSSAVTIDPAMLQWLNGVTTTPKRAPNENYAREMMELFTPRRRPRRLHRDRHPRAGAGADRLALRLVGRARRSTTSASTRTASTTARKTVFGRTGNWDWQDACRLCVEHPAPCLLLRREAVELLHPARRRPAGDPEGADRASTATPATRSGRWSRRS